MKSRQKKTTHQEKQTLFHEQNSKNIHISEYVQRCPIYIDIRKLVEGISADQDNETMAEIIATNFPASIEKR